jgi:hypothetical protein
MANSKQYYIRRGDQDHGPFTREQLLALGKEDKIEVDDTIVSDGTSTRAKRIKGLFPCRHARRQGNLVILPKGVKLPEVCLFKGTTTKLARESITIRTKPYLPSVWGWLGLFLTFSWTFGSVTIGSPQVVVDGRNALAFASLIMFIYIGSRLMAEARDRFSTTTLETSLSEQIRKRNKIVKLTSIFLVIATILLLFGMVLFVVLTMYGLDSPMLVLIGLGAMVFVVVGPCGLIFIQCIRSRNPDLVLENKYCIVFDKTSDNFLSGLEPLSDLEAMQLFDEDDLPLA